MHCNKTLLGTKLVCHTAKASSGRWVPDAEGCLGRKYNGMDSADMNHKYHGFSKHSPVSPQACSYSGCCLFRSSHCQLLGQRTPILRQIYSLRSPDGANSANPEHTRTTLAQRIIAASCSPRDRRVARNSLSLFHGMEDAK